MEKRLLGREPRQLRIPATVPSGQPANRWRLGTTRDSPSVSVGGLTGHQIKGFGFANYNGQTWWDHTGKTQTTSSMLNPPIGQRIEAIAATTHANETSPDKPRGNIVTAVRSWLERRQHVPATLGVTMRPTVLDTSARRYSLYTPELQLLSETEYSTSPTPSIAYDYVWFNGQPVAQIDNATGAIHYTFTDHLGTPILQTDNTCAVDWRIEADPYGITVVTRAGSIRHQPLRFPGQETEDGDRAYNIFRWYRAGWGRYTQADPGGLAGGINLFEYVENRPLVSVDPRGLSGALYVPKPPADPLVPSGCKASPWKLTGPPDDAYVGPKTYYSLLGRAT